jgi:hypothetical protein
MRSKKIVVLLLLGLIILSCKKNKSKDNTETKEVDQIVYKDLTPDITINSINFFTNLPASSPCYVPFPEDSTAMLDIDLNNDNVADFKIEISHHFPYQNESYCGHCPTFSVLVMITPLSNDCSVSIMNGSINTGKPFEASEKISSQNSWTNSPVMCYVSSCDGTYSALGSYLGLRIKNKFGWIKANLTYSMNGITISEFAINQTDNNSILAGQKQ